MNPIYLRLFDGYAADILQKADPFDSKSVDQLADSLSLSGDARLCLQDAFLARYLQWSTDAFTLGLHLGLSLVHDNVRRGGPPAGLAAPGRQLHLGADLPGGDIDGFVVQRRPVEHGGDTASSSPPGNSRPGCSR